MKDSWFMILLCLLSLGGRAQNHKKIPVGYDAYRYWERLPMQRLGVRAYMRSTYDRNGGGVDASNFLFMNKEDENVTLDVKGKGMLYFFRANHWHGSPWHFVVDGADQEVRETATADPVRALKELKATRFIPTDALPQPLAWTWGTTKGADLIWTPMGFRDSLRIAYSRTFYGTGYYIYHLFADERLLSRSVHAWTKNDRPDKQIVDLLNRAGTDIAPTKIKTLRGEVTPGRGSHLLATIGSAPAQIRALKLTLPLAHAEALERLRLKVTWDDAENASIDAPLCLFFGAGTLFNREKKTYLVKGLPMYIRYDYTAGNVELACFYPMPFFKQAKLELVGTESVPNGVQYEIRYERLSVQPHTSSYFHATYRDMPKPALGKDMVWLDTKGVEGHQAWSGSFVGTSFIFSHEANLNTLEGDPRFFFDDSKTPQAYGTGTEEWAGGGDYWGGENMTLPLAGHPCGAVSAKVAVNAKDRIQSAYRFLIADAMPFGKRAVIRFEHSENVSQEHYEAVTYWYGLPAPSLVMTDRVDIGDRHDEVRHAYSSPQASAVDTIHSRYEWGTDRFPAGAWGLDLLKRIPGYRDSIGKTLYPEEWADGRHTLGNSAFTVRLRSDNKGVLLRRTLDYAYPNQTAMVYVARLKQHKKMQDTVWQQVGIWYLAGANTFVRSKPATELGKRVYDVQTSNRRLRDDEFLIPGRLTKGCSAMRIKIVFIPNNQSLFPGRPFPLKSAWSELAYDVYSYVEPDFVISDL